MKKLILAGNLKKYSAFTVSFWKNFEPCIHLRVRSHKQTIALNSTTQLNPHVHDIGINESLMLHKGRLSWKQHIPWRELNLDWKSICSVNHTQATYGTIFFIYWKGNPILQQGKSYIANCVKFDPTFAQQRILPYRR